MKRKAFLASIFGAFGVARAHDLAPPANQWDRPMWTLGGKPVHNQCPVCGTMAEPYIRPKYDAYFGMCHGTGNADGTVTCEPPKMVIDPNSPTEHMARCKRCNAIFGQDAAK